MAKISSCNKKKQPVLVFTSSINKAEHYSKLLKEARIVHTVLNAKNHEKEAEIIANAGMKSSVIVTTSISGRGVDIKLGGKNFNELFITTASFKLSDKEKIKESKAGSLFKVNLKIQGNKTKKFIKKFLLGSSLRRKSTIDLVNRISNVFVTSELMLLEVILVSTFL